MTSLDFIKNMPKIELHVHVEGTIKGELLFEIAERNGIDLPYESPDGILELQNQSKTGLHENLVNFLKCLDISRGALRSGADYYDVAMGYYQSCVEDNTHYAEIMFDPQQAIRQGVAFGDCFEALIQARDDAADRLGVTSQWIMCFQRDHSLDSAMEVLEQAEPYREDIIGIGLDNSEMPGFPKTFAPLYDQARARGYRLTSHCDVNQPDTLTHIRDCLETLKVERIDHGLNVFQDPELLEKVIQNDIGLTACPTFVVSQKACPADRIEMIRGLFQAGALISLSTDDPAQFGSGWLTTTLVAAQIGGGFSNDEMTGFMKNAAVSAWMPDDRRSRFLEALSEYSNQHASG